MASKRIARLNEQFRREITEILRREVRDPRVGTPTITGVEVTPDLWMARVFVRPGPELAIPIPSEETTPPFVPEPVDGEPPTPDGASGPGTGAGASGESARSSAEGPAEDRSAEDRSKELLAGLEASASFVRRELGKVLSLRRVPELRFQLDRSFEHAARIEALLREVRPASGDLDVDGEDSEDGEGVHGDRVEDG